MSIVVVVVVASISISFLLFFCFIVIVIDYSLESVLLLVLLRHPILDCVLPLWVKNKNVDTHGFAFVATDFAYIMNCGLVLLMFFSEAMYF